VCDEGLETLTVEFDFAWLGRHGFGQPLDRSLAWNGGTVARAARKLAGIVRRPCSEATIGKATSAFLAFASCARPEPDPPWLQRVNELISRGDVLSARSIARALDLNADYLARAYRFAVGEGIHESLRRRRVERATAFLRRSDRPLVDVALDSGFCDQSHMNRCFRAVLGRTPQAVRNEGRMQLPAVDRPSRSEPTVLPRYLRSS
jgi:AraC-like DNA-binding protein